MCFGCLCLSICLIFWLGAVIHVLSLSRMHLVVDLWLFCCYEPPVGPSWGARGHKLACWCLGLFGPWWPWQHKIGLDDNSYVPRFLIYVVFWCDICASVILHCKLTAEHVNILLYSFPCPGGFWADGSQTTRLLAGFSQMRTSQTSGSVATLGIEVWLSIDWNPNLYIDINCKSSFQQVFLSDISGWIHECIPQTGTWRTGQWEDAVAWSTKAPCALIKYIKSSMFKPWFGPLEGLHSFFFLPCLDLAVSSHQGWQELLYAEVMERTLIAVENCCWLLL